MNNTILKKIGVTDKNIKFWLKKGLKISYPMLQNKKYFISEDGIAFVENGDKYVIPLSDKETRYYTNAPKFFKRDFLKNVRFYVQFINWLHALQSKTSSLNPRDKFIALLTILYLFQRGMDHHYYHFDRYLAYQNYPNTPVGYWWSKLLKLCNIIANKKLDQNIVLLHLLSKDEESKKLESSLNIERKKILMIVLKNISIFENAQEDEIKKVTDFKTKENILFRTAIPIWDELTKLLHNTPGLLKQEFRSKISEITKKHPLIAIRVVLSPEGLHYFTPSISGAFEYEIKRWVS